MEDHNSSLPTPELLSKSSVHLASTDEESVWSELSLQSNQSKPRDDEFLPSALPAPSSGAGVEDEGSTGPFSICSRVCEINVTTLCDATSSKTEASFVTTQTSAKDNDSTAKEESGDQSEYEAHQGQHILHGLGAFFTKPETLALDNSQPMLSIGRDFFFLLPNRCTPGQTLFRALGHALTTEEEDHYRIRKIVVNYIVKDGWQLLSKHVLPYYAQCIDELSRFSKRTKDLWRAEYQELLKKAYKHHFIGDEMEGSLIELVAASILYDFSYTCIFLISGDEECEVSKESHYAPRVYETRVIHSFDDKRTTCRAKKNHFFFFRSGSSRDEWRWYHLVPCRSVGGEVRQTDIPRGLHTGRLWKVFSYEWNLSASAPLPKLQRAPAFQWKHNSVTSVIATSSGKLLAGYTTLGRDLFSNICWLLHKHLRFYAFLKNSISTCKVHLTPSMFPSASNKAASAHLIRYKKYDGIGTLEELHKASVICRFAYQVIGINERGELYQLAESSVTGGKSSEPHILLARTSKGVVTHWCALDDIVGGSGKKETLCFSKIQLTPMREPYTKICHGPFGIRYRKDRGTNDPWK